jgi:hypothetical protein
MNALAEKIEPVAMDVSFTLDTLHVVLVDGREISAPLQWFPRLVNATSAQRSKWELIGDGIGINWPEIDEDVEVESLLAT